MDNKVNAATKKQPKIRKIKFHDHPGFHPRFLLVTYYLAATKKSIFSLEQIPDLGQQ
jgi:hypothetical protein